MNINDLLQGLDCKVEGTCNSEITSITFDSREITKGYAFVAIKGYEQDGHKYIASAISKGAELIVCQEIPKDSSKYANVCFVEVRNSRDALAFISNNLYGKPSERLSVVGVTGTNGKTSVTYILEEIFRKAEIKYGVFGTVNIRYGSTIIPSERSTPESNVINYHMSEMLKKDINILTMEVTSHALELMRVKYMKFKYGIFTNLSVDHLDFHNDLESYFYAKKKLFDQSEKCIINVSNEYGKRLYKELKSEGKLVISYGIDSECDVEARNIRLSIDGSYFDLFYKGELVESLFVSIPGKIYVENFLSAITMALDYGIEIGIIKEALKGVTIEGRVVSIKNNRNIGIILDFAHTPDALQNVLQTIKEFTTGKLITVFGCGGDRDPSKRPEMGNVATVISDYVIVTSDNPRTEKPSDIINDIIKGIKKDNFEIQADRRLAIRKAIGLARKGDVVVVAGKGHETYQIIGKEKFHFDDSEEIRLALGGMND